MSKSDIGLLEKHAQTILTALVAGAISWVGWSVTSQSEVLATLTERVSNLQSQVEKINDRPALTVSDFNILVAPILNRVETNKEFNIELKKRVQKIENDLYIRYVNPRKKQND